MGIIINAMKKSITLILAIPFVLIGCAGANRTSSFKPITSNGEACLAKCGTEKSQCLSAKGGDLQKTDSQNCEAAYSSCLAPCIKFDEDLRKAL